MAVGKDAPVELSPTNETPLLTLVWLKQDRPESDARRIVESMLRHSGGPYGRTARTGGDSQLAWGVVLPEKFTSLTCWSVHARGRELCLVEGDLYDDLPGLPLRPGDNPGLARHVAAQIRDSPNSPVTGVNGAYSGVYVPHDRSCAYAFGDPTGTRSLFWLSDAKRFVATNSLWGFRGCEGFERRWDPMALRQMLSFGFPLAGRTWLEGVRQLQRGRQVRSFPDGRTEVRMLVEPVDRQAWSLQQSVRMLRETLDDAVRRIHRRLGGPVGLALTGGLDSRTLLASLHSQHIEHRSFTFCLDPSERDNRVAESSAALLGQPHETIVLAPREVIRAPRGPISHAEYRLLNEGESPGFGFLQMAGYAQAYSKALLIGHEAVRETAGSFQPMFLTSKRQLANKMLREYLKPLSPKQITGLLAPAFRASWSDVLGEWYDSFDEIDQPTIMDVFFDHVADYRVQRRTRPRLEQVRWYCLPAYPYMDERLFGVYRRLPLAHLHAEQAPLALLGDYKTGLEKLPSAAHHFNLPIHREYRYRHLLRLGPYLKEMSWPWQERWRVAKTRLAPGPSGLHPTREPELRRLQHSPLFDGPALTALLARARRGTFVNSEAISRLINAGVLDDFLFGSGFDGGRTFSLLETSREIRFLPSASRPEEASIPI